MTGAVAEGDLHRSILHNVMCGDEGKEKQDCFSFRSKVSGFLLVFPSGGLLNLLCLNMERFSLKCCTF